MRAGPRRISAHPIAIAAGLLMSGAASEPEQPRLLAQSHPTALASDKTVDLYTVTFDRPDYGVGQVPKPGSGPYPRHTISSVGGRPVVVQYVGSLRDQPLHFEGMQQIRLKLGTGLDWYRITFDLLVESLSEPLPGNRTQGFNVLLDTPSVQVVRFRPDSRVWISQANRSVGGVPFTEIGKYEMGTPLKVTITADFANRDWSIKLGPHVIHHGRIFGDDVESLRFALQDRNRYTSSVGLDNVVVVGRSAE